MVGVLLLLLLALPFVEIAVFVQVADRIGGWWALAAIVAVGVLGLALMRREGLGVWRRAQQKLDRGELPADEVVNGMLILLAALLLVFPGFVTDLFALALLLPPVRFAVRSVLLLRFRRRLKEAFEGSGAMFGGAPARVDTGRATYRGAYEVHEVDDAPGGGDEAGGAAPSEPRELGRS